IVSKNEFLLSQPALGSGSFVAHDITRQRAHLRWRYTSFVEIMCPCFSRAAWDTCRPYLSATLSSWGTDLLFPKLLGYPNRQIAIVDETPVFHTRQPMLGDNIPTLQAAGIDPANEVLQLLEKYGFPPTQGWPYHSLLETYAAVDKRNK